MGSSASPRKVVLKMKRSPSRRCTVNQTTVFVTIEKSFTILQCLEAYRQLFKMNQYEDSARTIPHQIENCAPALRKTDFQISWDFFRPRPLVSAAWNSFSFERVLTSYIVLCSVEWNSNGEQSNIHKTFFPNKNYAENVLTHCVILKPLRRNQKQIWHGYCERWEGYCIIW